MELKGSKTDRRKQHILLDGFFYLMCIFCLGFVGCQPESEIVTVAGGQDNGRQSTESPDDKGKQISFKVVDSRIDARPGNSTQQRWVPNKTRQWRVVFIQYPASSLQLRYQLRQR